MPSLYTLKIVTDFAAAHSLRGYQGECSQLHGHNWTVEVEVNATKLDDVGIGIDFKLMKKATKSVIGELDHTHLNDLEAFKQINPTAENIAAYLYSRISAIINDDHVKVLAITIWETGCACVRYSEETI
ncbi:MAG: 6-carboxytetrahydropterin synthase QueD [Gammaproteobacteria bacterium]